MSDKIEEYTLQDPYNFAPSWLQEYRNIFNNHYWNISNETLNFHLRNMLPPNYLSREFAQFMMGGVPGLTLAEQNILNTYLESLFQTRRK
jgi:hypothetical protein